MQIGIRKAGLKDFSALRLLKQHIARETEHLATSQTDGSESLLYGFAKAYLQRRRVHTFVAEEGSALVGYVTIVTGKFQKVRATAYVVVGVRSSHRGQGIGTALLTRAEEFARERDMHRIELEVFATNEGAIRLYEKLGYEIEGRRREAVRTPSGYIDIVWMGKLL